MSFTKVKYRELFNIICVFFAAKALGGPRVYDVLVYEASKSCINSSLRRLDYTGTVSISPRLYLLRSTAVL